MFTNNYFLLIVNFQASTQTDAMRVPVPRRRQMKNKSVLCRPFTLDQEISCQLSESSTESAGNYKTTVERVTCHSGVRSGSRKCTRCTLLMHKFEAFMMLIMLRTFFFLTIHKMAAVSPPDAAASLVLLGIKNLLDHFLVFTDQTLFWV